MSVTVVANSSYTPPRFEVTIASADGSAITALALMVTAYGLTTPTRVQPTVGPSPRLAYDYEAPWATNVIYSATMTDSTGTHTDSSSPLQLTPSYPWLIHPTTPALSMPLDQGTPTVMGLVEAGTVSRADDAASRHAIIDSPYPTYVVSGPRSASQTQLTVATVTALEQQGLWALATDLTPILIRVPPAWGWDWEDGYYQVGKLDADRFMQYGPEHRRVFTLPLERVDVPAGTQQAIRTCATVLGQFSTCAALVAAYASCTNLLSDTRR